MMYFLNFLPRNDNVVWKESELVCKQIFKHFNTLENCEQVYANFFKELLGKFRVVGISLLVKITEVGSSSGKMERKQKRAIEFTDDTPLVLKSPITKGKGKKQIIVDILDEDLDEYTPRDESKLVEPDVIIAEGSDEEGALLKEKILQIVQEEDVMQNIVDIQLDGPSYEQDLIKSTLGRYFVQNNIELESLQNVFPEELIECIKEVVASDSQDKKEEEIILHLKEQFRLSLTKLKKKMNVLRQCINSSNDIYNYCLRWPHVVGKYKIKLKKIESELNKIGHDYNMVQDQDGAVKNKIHELQVEHTKIHFARNTLMDTFWKVKDQTECKLEQLIEVLRKGEKLEEAITILESLIQIINQTLENNSPIIIIGIVVDAWKKFLLEMKNKYKIIFRFVQQLQFTKF